MTSISTDLVYLKLSILATHIRCQPRNVFLHLCLGEAIAKEREHVVAMILIDVVFEADFGDGFVVVETLHSRTSNQQDDQRHIQSGRDYLPIRPMSKSCRGGRSVCTSCGRVSDFDI